MTIAPKPKELRQMSMSERLRLMEDLWASLVDKPEAVEIPAWHREELDARLEAHRANPSSPLDWSDAKAELARAPRK